VAQKVKDAIVDELRDRRGARPSVDKRDPDVLVAAHLARDQATLYLDVSGASLHERGWRGRAGEAPLRETLAAAILRLSGWDGQRPLVDPMCGAGTIAIEAASWAMGIAPGLSRKTLGLERWASHDDTTRRALRLLREEARAAARPMTISILASDVDPRATEQTRENAQAAGVALRIERRAVRDLVALDPPGFVVTNPPYGERLEVAPALYRDLAHSARRLRGHTVALLAGSPGIAAAMRREPDRWWILYNGPIECRLLVYRMA
jgi:putative N6-adenine-specific DNA methylase